MIVRPFDPWRSPLCTCPPKLSLNPYTGCAHGCIYCYAASYIPRFRECRPKADLLARLGREVKRLEVGSLVTASNSSDPYPPMERELELTRGCIKVLGESGLGLQVVTKSDLASRDADLLEGMSSAVAITVTTLDEPLARRLEPGAPRPGRRLEAIRALSRRGVPVSARLDPIIPGINDSDLDQLVSAVAEAGARHVTTSTFKAGPGSLRLLREEFPEEAGHLGKLFERGRRVGRSIYLPKEVRAGILDEVRRGCRERGLSFSACREGLYPPDGSCDGSHLISGPGKRGRSQVQSRGFR